MRFLSVLRFGLECPRLVRHVFGTVALGDDVANFGNGDGGERDRVGTHVRNKTDLVLAGKGNAFVKLLRNPHGALRVEPQLARGFLLQGGCRKRCCRVTAALTLVNAQDIEFTACCVEDGFLNFACSSLILKAELLNLLALVANQARSERLLILADIRLDGPVFACLEGFDFELPLDDHAQRRTLYAPSREASLYFFPQQR